MSRTRAALLAGAARAVADRRNEDHDGAGRGRGRGRQGDALQPLPHPRRRARRAARRRGRRARRGQRGQAARDAPSSTPRRRSPTIRFAARLAQLEPALVAALGRIDLGGPVWQRAPSRCASARPRRAWAAPTPCCAGSPPSCCRRQRRASIAADVAVLLAGLPRPRRPDVCPFRPDVRRVRPPGSRMRDSPAADRAASGRPSATMGSDERPDRVRRCTMAKPNPFVTAWKYMSAPGSARRSTRRPTRRSRSSRPSRRRSASTRR